MALLVLTVLTAAPGCSSGDLPGGLGGGKQVEARRGDAPRVVSAEGVSLTVRSVEPIDQGVRLELLAINGDDEEVEVSGENDPLVLEDDTGAKHQTQEKEIALGPRSATLLRVDFAGGVPDNARRLALRVEASRPVKLDVEEIPAPGSKRLEFVEPLPPPVVLTDRTAYHPNGASLLVRRVEFKDQVIEVGFQAVNGNDDEIRLNDSGRTLLQDQSGRRYLLVPPAENAKLTVPGYQRLSGTLRFAGRLAPGADRLSLVFNDRGSSDYDESATPKLTVSDIEVRR
ncbi:MAG: hypothetical protein M3396_06860 [Actinomycetota bacterium]|nr:hypothetical protein [Actinomycetota bacterium]MDQ3574335.1 hypothetical protein [Actinomycetota bacterium]